MELLYLTLEAIFSQGGIWFYFELLELWSMFSSLYVIKGTTENVLQRTSE